MFFDNMITAATSVAVLYLMVLAGFICDKTGIYTEKTAKKTIDLLFYLIGPCLMVNSILSMEKTDETVKKFFISLLIAFATHIIAIVLNLPFFRSRSDKDAVYKYGSIYGNVGFMALPLAQAVLGAEGVFYCTSGVIAFNVLCFTHGVAVMSKGDFKPNLKKLIVNPGVISVAIGLPLFLLEVKLPYVITQPLSLLGSLNTPVAMIIFGTYLSRTDLKKMFSHAKTYLTAFLKLIVLPLTCLGVYTLCGISGALLVAASITAGVPCANNTFMFASKYERDVDVASQTVALVSFMSILTLPVIIAIAQSV